MSEYIYQIYGLKGGAPTRNQSVKGLEDAEVTVILWQREWREDTIIVYEENEKGEIHSKSVHSRSGNIWHKTYLFVNEDGKNRLAEQEALFKKYQERRRKEST